MIEGLLSFLFGFGLNNLFYHLISVSASFQIKHENNSIFFFVFGLPCRTLYKL